MANDPECVSVYCLTFDVDWVPDPVIEDTLLLLERTGVRATFFATHASAALRDAAAEGHEIGLHPNFSRAVESDYRDIVMSLLKHFPDARGSRSHKYITGSPVVKLLGELGFLYDSNVVILGADGLCPWRHWNGLVCVPVAWGDYMMLQRPERWQLPRVAAAGAPVNCVVLNLHPVHVFLNTTSLEHYSRAKSAYHEPRRLAGFRAEGTPGVRTFLEAFLHDATQRQTPIITAAEAASRFLHEQDSAP